MNRTILASLDCIPYFTIEGVKQLLADSPSATVRTALYRWMKTGQVIQLKKGVYLTRRFFELHHADADFSPAISAVIQPQSYVSLEFILQRRGLLTEITYPVSAVTLKHTLVVKNNLGSFSYRHIQPELYHGFSLAEYLGIRFAQATAPKALFDYLYLRPADARLRFSNYNLAEELRLNLDLFSPAEQIEFACYVNNSRILKMEHILENLRRTVWQP
jgi:predicted transcriptional regulator of viral defense system